MLDKKYHVVVLSRNDCKDLLDGLYLLRREYASHKNDFCNERVEELNNGLIKDLEKYFTEERLELEKMLEISDRLKKEMI